MKRIVSVILAVIMVFSTLVVFADSDIILTVNGNVVNCDVPPIIVNGRTMVPFRAIFEALGIPVKWSDALRKAYTTQDGASVVLTVDSDKMLVNGSVITLEVAPFITEGRLLVPARAICEALECKVNWIDETRTVVIETKDYVEPSYDETIGGDPEYIVKEEDRPNKILALVNAEREALGLSALTYDSALESIAYNHSADMAEKSYLDHTSPEGFTLENRLDNAGVTYGMAGENLASGFTSSDAVIKAWKNSPSHYETLVNPLFTKVGLGYFAGGENGTYWTLVLIAE